MTALSQTSTVLVVEDDPDVRLGCEQALQLAGWATLAAESVEASIPLLAKALPHAVVTDIRLPGRDGMELLRDLHKTDPDLPVILITGHGDVAMAVQAMKDGAYDFLEKPFSPDTLVDVTRHALEKRRLVLELRELRSALRHHQGLESRLVGTSAAIERVRRLIGDLGDVSADVLIQGETGTGKELVARCLHETGGRRTGNFVALNCGALPETLFESEIFGHEAGAFTGAQKRRIGKIEHANGGTLFLDEIESMPLPMQVKFLRVLQERTLERLGSNTPVPVDCRVVAASKVDLRTLVDRGEFRADLYYRLNVVNLLLPPLRDRREDIPLLFQTFALQAAIRHERPTPVLDPEHLQALMAHDWPGNVRELRNVAERAALGISENIFAPTEGGAGGAKKPLAEAVESFERSLIAEALRRHNGNLSQTADALATAKTTLFDKIKKYGLSEASRR